MNIIRHISQPILNFKHVYEAGLGLGALQQPFHIPAEKFNFQENVHLLE